eukprot:scaffold20179_cov103-Isochrysis_galbana.AAC.3
MVSMRTAPVMAPPRLAAGTTSAIQHHTDHPRALLSDAEHDCEGGGAPGARRRDEPQRAAGHRGEQGGHVRDGRGGVAATGRPGGRGLNRCERCLRLEVDWGLGHCEESDDQDDARRNCPRQQLQPPHPAVARPAGRERLVVVVRRDDLAIEWRRLVNEEREEGGPRLGEQDADGYGGGKEREQRPAPLGRHRLRHVERLAHGADADAEADYKAGGGQGRGRDGDGADEGAQEGKSLAEQRRRDAPRALGHQARQRGAHHCTEQRGPQEDLLNGRVCIERRRHGARDDARDGQVVPVVDATHDGQRHAQPLLAAQRGQHCSLRGGRGSRDFIVRIHHMRKYEFSCRCAPRSSQGQGLGLVSPCVRSLLEIHLST